MTSEAAQQTEHVIDQLLNREVARERDEKQQSREKRKEKVVGELRCQPDTVVFPERLMERAFENLTPCQRYLEGGEQESHGTSVCT